MAWRFDSYRGGPDIEQFNDVDAGDRSALIGYLDLVARISAEDKRKTFEAQRIATGMRVLDLGCGTGDDVRAIAALVGETGFATGTDSSQAMIDEAQARGVPVNASFLRCSADRLPFDDASFDAARAERVFQHLDDPMAAAVELRRVVKPGGSVLLLDQDWESLSVGGADPAVARTITRAFADRLANGSAGAQARGLLRRAGFSHVELAPMITTPALPVAFELIFKSAVNAALDSGAIDSATGAQWLRDLLQSETAGAFYCAVVVVAALAR